MVLSRIEPTSWGMTAMRPSTVTVPSAPASSPPMMRRRVVLPTPLAPTRATWSPSPTRNDDVLEEGVAARPGPAQVADLE